MRYYNCNCFLNNPNPNPKKGTNTTITTSTTKRDQKILNQIRKSLSTTTPERKHLFPIAGQGNQRTDRLAGASNRHK